MSQHYHELRIKTSHTEYHDATRNQLIGVLLEKLLNPLGMRPPCRYDPLFYVFIVET